jgi:phage RecT family recombinase
MATAARPESTTTAVVQEERAITARDLPAVIRTSKSARKQIEAFLPEGVSLDRVAASLDLALRKARQEYKGTGLCPLEKCDPATMLLAVAKIQQWGLEIGETAHLVPFGATCTPVADYKGLEELMVASGVARMVQSRCVYAKEPFRLKIGTPTELEHHPIASIADRGPMVSAYVIVHVRGGLQLVESMGVEEIDAIRKQYSKQWKEGPLTEWYARKTVIRRVAKHVPKNPRLARILAEIDREEVMEVPAELARAMVSVRLDEEEEPARVHQIGSGEVTPPSQASAMPQPDAPALAADGAVGYDEVPAKETKEAKEPTAAKQPAICARCGQSHRFDGAEDLGNGAGTCFKYTPDDDLAPVRRREG